MMVKAVKGFQASDGTFFDDKQAAEFHEASADLHKGLTDLGINPEKFMTVTQQLIVNVERFINAAKALPKTDKFPSPIGQHTADDANTEEDLTN